MMAMGGRAPGAWRAKARNVRLGLIALAAGVAAMALPAAASAHWWDRHPEPGDQASVYDRDRDNDRPNADVQAEAWRDAAHRRDRIDAVEGSQEFAREESRMRAEFDAGLAEGWLNHDDFLIFGRQLHQTELHEARVLRVHNGEMPRAERALIRSNLEELRRQLEETRHPRWQEARRRDSY